MPHLTIEYSENLESHLDGDRFLQAMAEAMQSTGVFRTGGVRIRAYPVGRFHVADGHENNGFMALTLKIAPGRTREQKTSIGQSLLATAGKWLEKPLAGGHLSLSVEVSELDPDFRWNVNSIHERLSSG